MSKHLHLIKSLAYGVRLTRKYALTLLPGTAVFFLPECMLALGLPWTWDWLRIGYKAVLSAALLWHALDLSDKETAGHRKGARQGITKNSWNFILSTGLFWGVIFLLACLPLLALCSTASVACAKEALATLKAIQLPQDSQLRLLMAFLLALPCGLWTLYGWFHGYYVADEGQRAWPSMRSSFVAVRGAELKVAVFLTLIAAINALGLYLYVAGVFVAFPVTLMATTFVHLELKKQTFKR